MRVVNNITIYEDKDGLVVNGCFSGGSTPTTANFFAKGCILTDLATGKVYTNAGSVASPSFQDINDVATAEIADQAVTMPKIVRGTDGQIIVANTGADSAYVSMSGDITMDKTGATTIGSNKVGVTELETSMDFTGSVLANISIPEGTPVNAVASVGTLTVSGTPVADETLIIGGTTYTFKALRSTTGEITIDADNATQVTNIIAATDLDSTDVVCTDGDGNTVVVTAVTKGTIGDSLALTSNATGVAVTEAMGVTVAGVDGTVGAAREMLADSSYIYYTNVANSTSGTNWRRISLGSLY